MPSGRLRGLEGTDVDGLSGPTDPITRVLGCVNAIIRGFMTRSIGLFLTVGHRYCPAVSTLTVQCALKCTNGEKCKVRHHSYLMWCE